MNRRDLLALSAGTAAYRAFPASTTSVSQSGCVRGESVISGVDTDRWGRPIREGTGGIGIRVASRDTGYAWAVFESHVQPSSGVPLHVHRHQEEWFHVLNGEFLFEIGGDIQRLTSGMSILGPRQTPHRFKNVGQSTGKLLILAQPAGLLEQAFDDIAQLPQNKMHDPQTLKQLLARYDIDVIGPPLA